MNSCYIYALKMGKKYEKRYKKHFAEPDGVIPNYDIVGSFDYEVELGVVLN
ncbi:MAG: hypothetical protein IJJ74_04625 [Eubacterium sp.]|nr:hypothetical protein [Eubacterium sp.]